MKLKLILTKFKNIEKIPSLIKFGQSGRRGVIRDDVVDRLGRLSSTTRNYIGKPAA